MLLSFQLVFIVDVFLVVFNTNVCFCARMGSGSVAASKQTMGNPMGNVNYGIGGGDNIYSNGQYSRKPKRDGNETNSLNELLGSIFSNYHKELVPKRPTVVKMDLLLLKVKSTVEKEGIFESVVALFIEWTDERLVWDPSEFDNVSILAFDSDKVWLPDIAMTNSADHLYSISKDTRFVVRVSHEGDMKFVPTGTARTWCHLKLLTFPFDIQTCSLEFESWSLDSSTMTFNTSAEALVDDGFASPQWSLCQKSALVYENYYDFTGETFTRVRFDFIVQRKSTFYIINLIFPCATLSLIQLLVFVIPSTDSTSDRVGFGTTNLLTLVVFQTIVTEEMPKSSDAVTALSKYIIALIIISAVGIFESVIAERMLRTTSSPPPDWTYKYGRFFPLLWSPQLPTGLTQMILDAEFDEEEDEEEIQNKRSQAKNRLKKKTRPVDVTVNLTTENSVYSSLHENAPQRPNTLKFNTSIQHSTRKKTSNVESSSEYSPIESKNRLSRKVHRNSFIFTDLSRKISRSLERHHRLQVDNAYYASIVSPNGPDKAPPPPPRCGFYTPYNRDNIVFTATQSEAEALGFQSTKNWLLGLSPGTENSQSGVSNADAKSRKKSSTKSSFPNDEPKLPVDHGHDLDEDSESDDDHYMTRLKNGRMWGIVVTKIDTITFLICTFLALGIPLGLFVPLMAGNDICNT